MFVRAELLFFLSPAAPIELFSCPVYFLPSQTFISAAVVSASFPYLHDSRNVLCIPTARVT